MEMLQGFRKFIIRGNVVDLAIGVVVGAAFNSVVQALVKDLLTPLISAISGEPDFSKYMFTVNGSQFMYGDFLNAVISFVIIAASVYFFVVVPMNTLMARFRKDTDTPSTEPCPFCLTQIPVGAKKCAHCTADLRPQAG